MAIRNTSAGRACAWFMVAVGAAIAWGFPNLGNSRRWLWVALSALAATIAVGAAVAVVQAGTHTSRSDVARLAHALRAARRYRGFPLYWDGMRLGKLPLTDVNVAADHLGIEYTFSYGHVVDGEEGCCGPSLEVQVTALCNRLPSQVGVRVGRLRIRGAPTSAAEAGADNGGDSSVYTEGATITLYGDSHKLDLRAAAALRRLNPATSRVGPDDALPAASRRVLRHGCN